MKRFYTILLIFVLSFSTFAMDLINLAGVVNEGKVLVSDPPKEQAALDTIIDGVIGNGGLLLTISRAKAGRILLELGGNSLNTVEQAVLTVQVAEKEPSKACEVKISTATKPEGPFVEAGRLGLPYSGARGTVFETQKAKYVLFEFISNSEELENVLVEEVELYGLPLDEQPKPPKRVSTKDNISLFNHLGLEISWAISDFKILTPKPISLDSYPKISPQTDDVTIRFNVDGRLTGRINVTGQLSIPSGWEKLFLPETVYVRCYYTQDGREWLIGGKTVIVNEIANEVDLTLSLGENHSWPVGKYRVEIFIGTDTLPLSSYFSVEEVKENADSTVVGP